MRTLELLFVTEEGKTVRLSVDNPKEPVDPLQVKTAMESIIAANAFIDNDGNAYESYKGARLIERNVTVLEIN